MRPATDEKTVLILISTRIVGGPGKGLLQLIPALTERGRIRPVLCTFRRRGEDDTPFVRAAHANGIEPQFLEQRFNLDLRPIGQLRRMAETQGADLIQTHGYKENVFGLALKQATGLPWVCFLHGTTDENLKVKMYHAIDRLAVRVADRVVAVSQELANRIVPPPCLDKVRVVENAIAPVQRQQKMPTLEWRRRNGIQGSRVVSCIGRLSPEKGQDIAIDAVQHLIASGVDCQLLLVGDGLARKALEARCAARGLGRFVRFMGEQADMDCVYRASDIVVLPSRKEGMPNVILEAMVHGRAIVASRVGAVPEMLRDGVDGILVPREDPNALALALKELLERPNLARALGRAARKRVFPRYSVERRVDKMEQVYAEVLGNE